MFESANDFSMFIETTANEKNIGVVDALLQYCRSEEHTSELQSH